MSLTKRNGVYYAQLSVPEDVRHIIKKNNYRKSTGCRTRNAALLESIPPSPPPKQKTPLWGVFCLGL